MRRRAELISGQEMKLKLATLSRTGRQFHDIMEKLADPNKKMIEKIEQIKLKNKSEY